MVLNLCDAGHEVVVLDNLTTGFDWAVDVLLDGVLAAPKPPTRGP